MAQADTFIEKDGSEERVLHHFTDKNELEQLFKCSKAISIESYEKELKADFEADR